MSDAAIAKIEDAPAPASTGESGALVSMIERAARDPSVDIDKMERLYQMHERVEAKAREAAYLAALSQMQAELPTVARRGRGHNDKTYARFEDIIAAIRPVLVRHGFSLSFRTAQDEKSIRVTGVLGHCGGHTEATEIVLPADTSGNKNIVQAWGSSTSYGKRYVSLTLLGIASENEDNDGKTASGVITGEQAEELAKLVTETETDIAAFLAIGGVESLSDIPASQFNAAKAKLLAKKAQMKKGAKP